MIRLTAPGLALVLALAGCIAVPEDPDATPAATVEPQERIDGMTASVTQTDTAVDCDNGLQIPPRACYERELVVEGRIGVDHLPIELLGANGEISILPSEGDAWSFRAKVRVSALTEDMAREGLDTAWMWTHERDGGHALVAGPASTSAPILGPTAWAMSYEVRLPAWITIDLVARTDSGVVLVRGFAMGSVDAETDNGEIHLAGKARDIKARTDNGQIVLDVRPASSGTFDLATDNGQIVVSVPEGRSYGYDVAASTDNGQIIIGPA